MAQVPCKFYQDGTILKHTPSVAVPQGGVVLLGTGLVGIAIDDIPANTPGSVTVRGSFWMPKVTGAISALAQVYWDADADPLGGDAGSGAITTTASGNTAFGHAVFAAGGSDQMVLVLLPR